MWLIIHSDSPFLCNNENHLVFIQNRINVDPSMLEKLRHIMKTEDVRYYVLFLQKIRMNDILSNIL